MRSWIPARYSRALRKWLRRGPECKSPLESGLIPQDPSGRPATGEDLHLHVAPAGDFWIRTDRLPPAILKWYSTDTSIVRLEVSADTFSALVKVLNPGRATITVSDGLTMVKKVVTVRERLILGERPIGTRIEPILNVAGAGNGQARDEILAPANLT